MAYQKLLRILSISSAFALITTTTFAAPYDLEPIHVNTVGHYEPLDLYPVAVAVDDQLVYILDLFHEEVRARSHDGAPVWSFPYIGTWPRDIEVDAAGNIYMPDANQQNIKKYSPTGELLLTIGEKGTAPGQFGRPLGIVLDQAGNIYVGDYTTGLSKFDSNGNLIWNNLDSGNTATELEYPMSIALDSGGNIYVADADQKKIVIFDPDGNYLRSIGPSGTGYNWVSPVGIAITADDYIIILDRLQGQRHIGQNQIFKLNGDGTLINSWGAKGRAPGELWEPQGLTLGTNNDIWVAGFQGHNVIQYNVDGTFLKEWNDHDIQPYEFAEIVSTQVGAHGRLYVTDFWNQVVQVFDRYGNFDFMWGERGQGDGQVFNFPRFTAVNDAGEIYIDDDHEVRRFDSEGNFLSRSDRINYPGGIDIDSSGNVWVTGRFENTLRKYTPDLQLLQVIDGTGIPQGLNEPTNISVSPTNGNLYLTDKLKHRVLVLDRDGNYLMTWGLWGNKPGNLNHPIGIAIDSRGLVYVSELVTKRIQVFNANGEYLYGWGVPGTSENKVSDLWDISLDGDYFLYGADRRVEQAEVHKWALVPDPAINNTPTYVVGEDLGFYIWSNDGAQWHLRWTSDGVLKNFSGVITSTVPFIGSSGIDLEAGDQIESITSTRIEFNANETIGQDGIDIVTGTDSLIIFDLSIDGIEQKNSVFVGSGSFTPTGLPIPLRTVSSENIPAIGKPTYTPKIDPGYYIWQDNDDSEWHIRWSGDSTRTFDFNGTINTSNPPTDLRAFSFESNDTLTLDVDTIGFSAKAGSGEDGIDFFVPVGTALSFTLELDRMSDPGTVYIGADSTNPSNLPFSLISADTSDLVFGQPNYIAAIDLGYYIWRDNNVGDWHLRWSGDSVKTYDFTGTIISSLGFTNHSEYSFESNDIVEVIPSGLRFTGRAGRGEDGLNFSVPANSQLFFELQINGFSDSTLVKYGVNNMNAAFLPLSVYSRSFTQATD